MGMFRSAALAVLLLLTTVARSTSSEFVETDLELSAAPGEGLASAVASGQDVAAGPEADRDAKWVVLVVDGADAAAELVPVFRRLAQRNRHAGFVFRVLRCGGDDDACAASEQACREAGSFPELRLYGSRNARGRGQPELLLATDPVELLSGGAQDGEQYGDGAEQAGFGIVVEAVLRTSSPGEGRFPKSVTVTGCTFDDGFLNGQLVQVGTSNGRPLYKRNNKNVYLRWVRGSQRAQGVGMWLFSKTSEPVTSGWAYMVLDELVPIGGKGWMVLSTAGGKHVFKPESGMMVANGEDWALGEAGGEVEVNPDAKWIMLVVDGADAFVPVFIRLAERNRHAGFVFRVMQCGGDGDVPAASEQACQEASSFPELRLYGSRNAAAGGDPELLLATDPAELLSGGAQGAEHDGDGAEQAGFGIFVEAVLRTSSPGEGRFPESVTVTECPFDDGFLNGQLALVGTSNGRPLYKRKNKNVYLRWVRGSQRAQGKGMWLFSKTSEPVTSGWAYMVIDQLVPIGGEGWMVLSTAGGKHVFKPESGMMVANGEDWALGEAGGEASSTPGGRTEL